MTKVLADAFVLCAVIAGLCAVLITYFAFCERIISWFCRKTKDKEGDK